MNTLHYAPCCKLSRRAALTSDALGGEMSGDAWFVNFNNGTVFTFPKGADFPVRAVRTGSCL